MSPFASTRRTAVLIMAAVLLTGCTSAVAGQAVKIGGAAGTSSTTTADPGPTGPKSGVAAATVPVTNDGKTQSDLLATNAIADLYAYYTGIFPTDFSKTFTPAKELISYDSNDQNSPKVCGRPLYKVVNASYNPSCDTIVWDRGVLLPDLAKDTGILAAPTVLSHEMGHLVQNRLAVTANVLTLEEQADCYAGAYWRWVADGHSKYFDLNQTDGVRQVLSAMMSTGDQAGTTNSVPDAHGSGFDRTYSFSLGYSNGAVRCNQISEAEVAARLVETGFTVLPTNFANVEITDKFIGQVTATVNAYFTKQVPGYKAPTVTGFTGDKAPDCAGTATLAGTVPVTYCPGTNTISYNLATLKTIGTPTKGYSSHGGDFSAVLMLVSRFGLAAQATTGGTVLGNQAGLRGLCYAGSWASWMRKPQGADHLALSPNDLNKAVYQVMASSVPASDAAGATSTTVIDQVQALYIGVVNGAAQCFDFYSR